jgi:hypothetical protein
MVLADLPAIPEGALAVSGLMATWINLRGALAGFLVLARGGSAA